MPTFSHSAGGVVLNVHGEVLLVNQRDRSWSFPKGKINEGEDPHDAAMREVIEETGLMDLQPVSLLKSYTRFALTNAGQEDKNRFKRITMYLFRTEQTDVRPMDPRILEAKWVPMEEVTSVLSNHKDREFFTEIVPELKKFEMQIVQ